MITRTQVILIHPVVDQLEDKLLRVFSRSKHPKSTGGGTTIRTSWRGKRVTKKKSWRGGRAKGKKYSGGDKSSRPKAGTRKRYWRSGYRRRDGSRVKGHYVKNPNYQGK